MKKQADIQKVYRNAVRAIKALLPDQKTIPARDQALRIIKDFYMEACRSEGERQTLSKLVDGLVGGLEKDIPV